MPNKFSGVGGGTYREGPTQYEESHDDGIMRAHILTSLLITSLRVRRLRDRAGAGLIENMFWVEFTTVVFSFYKGPAPCLRATHPRP